MITAENRISRAFARLRSNGEKGIITYLTAGYPNPRHTLDILKALADSGSDLIEIGVPFSDPVADGPVIQKASHCALESGIKLADIFRTAEKLRYYTDIPILLMTYYNPVFKPGIGSFVKNARDAGIDGLIVPDLPAEEDAPLRSEAGQAGLSLISLVAPTSTPERIKKIASRAEGFIYCVSVAGVTGARQKISTGLGAFTKLVREHTGLPLAVGFGISGPETASRAAAHCDAVVVGSAIIEAVSAGGNLSAMIKNAAGLTSGIKKAICRGID